MSKRYNYLIVGAGLYGSVFAEKVTKKGKTCLVIDRRSHIGGNCFTEKICGITIHKYGAHIFHTSNEKVWDYIRQFTQFNSYINAPIAIYKGKVYNLPFNMNTFSQLWGIISPQQAKYILDEQCKLMKNVNPRNLEEQALSLVGQDIYETLIKGYTEKQWGRSCTELPSSIIKRLPIRFTYDNNYFKDKYQGIPIGGYTQLFRKMLNGVEVLLNTDYKSFIESNPDIAEKIVYSGSIDEFFDFCYGKLAYRTLEFKNEILDMDNFQGNAVVNYTERQIPFTRIIEHKHFEFGDQSKTVITYEYPKEWKSGCERLYPINDETNSTLYSKYLLLAEKCNNVIFGGRLGRYQYMDMDKTIANAFSDAEAEIQKER